jgi:hypothetical protein
MRSEYSMRRDWKFPGISYLTDLRQTICAKNIPKTVLKTKLKTAKKPRTQVPHLVTVTEKSEL